MSDNKITEEQAKEELAMINEQLKDLDHDNIPKKAEQKGLPLGQRKKICILGFAATSRNLAPFNDPEWEIWGLNGLYKEIAWPDNMARWYEFHPRHDIDSYEAGGGEDYVKFLQGLKIPLYTECKYPDIPTSEVYPLAQICDFFHIGSESRRALVNPHMIAGNIKNPYFTNSISMMVAHAIHDMLYYKREIEEIAVYGVDMSHATEYGHQKPSCEFYLGICEGLRLAGKLKTWGVPKESSLLKHDFIYGYEGVAQGKYIGTLKARKAQLNNILLNYQNQERSAHDAAQQFLGALQENDHVLRNFGS